MKKPILEVSPKTLKTKTESRVLSIVILLTILIIIFGFTFDGEYIDLSYYWLIFFLGSIFYYINAKKVCSFKFYEDGFIYKTAFSIKEHFVNYSQTSYNESYKILNKNILSGEQTGTDKLKIYLPKTTITILKQETSNYNQIFEILKARSKWNYSSKFQIKIGHILPISIFCLSGIFFCLTLLGYSEKRKDNEMSVLNNQYKEINTIISSIEYTGKQHSFYIKPKNLRPYNFYPFDNSRYYQIKNFKENFKENDSITLYISTNEYEKKILKSKKLKFVDKYLAHDRITFYGIKNSNFEFLPKNQ